MCLSQSSTGNQHLQNTMFSWVCSFSVKWGWKYCVWTKPKHKLVTNKMLNANKKRHKPLAAQLWIMQYARAVLVMFVNPNCLYLVTFFPSKHHHRQFATHRLTHLEERCHICAHTWMYKHADTVVGKWPWKASLKLFLRNCSAFKHVAVAKSHLFLAWKSTHSSLCVFSFVLYSVGISGCWFSFPFPRSNCMWLISSRVLTHLNCFYVRI